MICTYVPTFRRTSACNLSLTCCSWRLEFPPKLKNKKPTRCHLLYLLYFLDTQHVSAINMSIFRSLRLCCWTTTLAVLFLDCCVLDLGCGSARVLSGLPAAGRYNKWHLVGFLFFNYHNDARVNKHHIPPKLWFLTTETLSVATQNTVIFMNLSGSG